ncbi:MAG: arginine--tRNA ligase [Polyangia bacterium]
MLDLSASLGRRAAQALRTAFPDATTIPTELPVTRATKPEFGELQLSGALQLGKALGKNPRELATIISNELASAPEVEKTEIAGPGFVNVHLRTSWLARRAAEIVTDQRFGLRNIGQGERVVIDYSSPNVAKPMHIAHIRSTIIGDATKRVLRALGYEVIADNHLGDWGTQFGKLIVAYRRWLDAEAFERSPVDELLRLYVKFVDEEKRQRAELGEAPPPNVEAEEDEGADPEHAPPILKEARAELVLLQRGDPDNVALWTRFVDVSLREFERVYERLGVTFDVMLGESFYNDRLVPTLELMIERGIAEESRGAFIVTFDKVRDGAELPPFLVRKADGGFLYGTTDVAGVLYRIEKWKPSRIIIVTDERQQLHFKQLFATARRLDVDVSLEHVWFGLMRLAEGTISTRDGNVISLEALLDEAVRRARVAAAEHNPELTSVELDEVARVVGIGAVKYNDLSRDRQTMVTFTWDKALSLTGNTAPYLQYAYARMQSILRKAEAEHGARPGSLGDVALGPAERRLLVELHFYDQAVEEVGRTARPHVLSDYLFNVASAFSTFYAETPVLKAEARERTARLALCDLTARTLRHGLDLLGIQTLDRM